LVYIFIYSLTSREGACRNFF